MNFLIRWLVTALAAAVALWIIPGIYVVGNDSLIALIIFSLVLALVNASIKPVAQMLSLPISVITLGVFYLVVNALLLMFAAWVADGLFGSGF